MYIPESLLLTDFAKEFNWSGLNIYCKDEQKKEIRSFFKRTFDEEWIKAINKLFSEVYKDYSEDQLGNYCNDQCPNDNPMQVIFTEEGLFATFEPLDIRYGQFGERSDIGYGDDALRAALHRLEQQYPDIVYEGYIAYDWSDMHGGGIEQYPIASKNTTKKDSYDFIGVALSGICEYLSDDFISEFLKDDFIGFLDEEPEEELKAFLCLAANHSEWVDAEAIYNFVLEIAEKFSEEVGEIDMDELNELVEKLRAGEKIMEVSKDDQWVSEVSVQEVAAKESAEKADQQAAKEIVTTLLERDDGRLKRLLLLPVADCLTTSDPSLLEKIQNVNIDELYSKGYIRFEIGAVDEYEATDCYLVAIKQTIPALGYEIIVVSFTVVCNTKFCDMDDCKIRPIEICSVLNELANGQEFSGIGKLKYGECEPSVLSSEYYSCSLFLNPNPFSSGDVTPKNELAQYNVDSKAIIQALLKDGTLKRLLEVDEMSDDDILNAGYIQLWTNLERSYKAWLMIEWNFSTDQSVSVVTVCRNDSRQTSDGGDRLKQISEFVKNTLDNFILPVRGNISCDSVKENQQLGDELTMTSMTFK